MRQARSIRPALGLAAVPWLVAGALLLGASTARVAQEATPGPGEVTTEASVDPDKRLSDTTGGTGGDSAASSVPSTGVGATGSGGSSWTALGAGVGAAVAAAAALRERFLRR
jgi:hypothetical protein